MEENEKQQDLTNIMQGLFQATSGEEDMLRVATKYTLQLTQEQVKLLLFIKWASTFTEKHRERLNNFVNEYLEMKQYCNSGIFVMKLFEFLSLKRFIETGLDLKVQK